MAQSTLREIPSIPHIALPIANYEQINRTTLQFDSKFRRENSLLKDIILAWIRCHAHCQADFEKTGAMPSTHLQIK